MKKCNFWDWQCILLFLGYLSLFVSVIFFLADETFNNSLSLIVSESEEWSTPAISSVYSQDSACDEGVAYTFLGTYDYCVDDSGAVTLGNCTLDDDTE